MNCEFCSSPVHVWFQCPKKPDGWKPARLAKENRSARVGPAAAIKPDTSGSCDAASGSSNHLAPELKSTAARKDVLSDDQLDASAQARGLYPTLGSNPIQGAQAGTQALPVDTNREPFPSSDCKSDALPKEGLAAASSNLGAPTKFNKNEYQKAYMREVYRPRLKAKKEAAK